MSRKRSTLRALSACALSAPLGVAGMASAQTKLKWARVSGPSMERTTVAILPWLLPLLLSLGLITSMPKPVLRIPKTFY